MNNSVDKIFLVIMEEDSSLLHLVCIMHWGGKTMESSTSTTVWEIESDPKHKSLTLKLLSVQLEKFNIMPILLR